MTDFANEYTTGQLATRNHDCTHCKAPKAVVERSEYGIEFGECTECHTKYLPPDWDAIGKEF